MTTDNRSGILAGGNFIIDYVKIIDDYPAENMLASILSESPSNGGGPYNVLRDLAAMGAPFPLEAAGLVGKDANGDRILEDCRSHGIDTSQLHQTGNAPTSYTDAMTVQSTGRRTFFHQRGANALLDDFHFDFTRTRARLFHLAYLILLDTLDTPDGDGEPGSARVLKAARAEGIITSADIVSAEHPRFSETVGAALPHIDYLIINEIEAEKITGVGLRPLGAIDLDSVREAGAALLLNGVQQGVVIHFEEGAVAFGADGDSEEIGSLDLPQEFIKGATGAGDAFAAGFLFGIHEGLTTPECLRHAICVAAACLSHPATSEGIMPLEECLALGDRFGFRMLDS